MHINKTSPDKTTTKLTIRASEEELSKAKVIAVKHLSTNVKVPGFRGGKVPPAVAEKHVDQNELQTEVIEHTVNNLYKSAINQEGLRPVASPEVNIKKFVPFSELEFEVIVPTIGEVKLADYKKIKLAKPEAKVLAKDIDEVIKSLSKQAATRNEVKRAVKKGDEVTIDFSGTDKNGKLVAGADGKDYPLVIGSGAFIPGFEEELNGLKTGDKKSFDITFPKDYGVQSMQNMQVTFAVDVKKISEVVEPAIDDDFATAIGPFKNLKELKEDINKQLTAERQREANAKYENDLLDKIADKSVVDVPKMLVEEQVNQIEEEEKRNLAYKGQTWEEHLKEEGVNAEEHRAQKFPAAERRVKISILLTEIADAENVEVSPEELEVRIQLLKGQYQDEQMRTELDRIENQREIEGRLRAEKTLIKLSEYTS